MGHLRTVRGRSAVAVWLAIGAVLTAVLGGAMGSAQAAQDTSPLRFVKYFDSTELTGGPDQDPIPVAVDAGLGKAVLFRNGFLLLVDTASLTETKAINTRKLVGKQSGFSLDAKRHVVYISGRVPDLVPGSGIGLSGCSAGVPASTVCGAAAPAGLVAPKIQSVDLLTGASNVVTLPDEAAGQNVVAMATADRPGGDPILYALLYSDASQGGMTAEKGFVAPSLTLYAIDAAALLSGPSGPAKVLWSYPVNSCATLVSASSTGGDGANPDFLGVDPAGGFVYFGCRGLVEYTNGTHPSPTGAVVVTFPKPFTAERSTAGFGTEFYPNGASAKYGLSGGDATRSLLYIATIGSRNYLRVFNAAQRAWTGTVLFQQGGGTLSGLATDLGAGRAYIFQPSPALVSADTGRLPVDQGAALPLGDAAGGAGGLLVDPVTRRIFLLGTPDSRSGKEPITVMSVLQDTRPAPLGSEPADPDSLTHQVPVTPDTPVAYSAFASGYGAKAIAHGSENLGETGSGTPSQAASNAISTCNNGVKNFGGTPDAPACIAAPGLPEGTRSIAVGQVRETELSNSAAKANATSMAVDEITEGNARTLSSTNPTTLVNINNVTPPDTTGAPPPPDTSEQSAPASCADFGDRKSAPTGAGSTAACDHTGQQAGAAAVSPAALQLPGLEVASAMSATRVARTADNQVLTVANASARGIVLSVPGGPTVRIGEVAATATSAAAGRTGTAGSSYDRIISAVTVTDPAGAQVFACGFTTTPACDPRQLTAVVSRYTPAPVLFLTPDPDPDPQVRASAGGAQAVITKSRFQYWNDYFTGGDVGSEVAGLQVVLVGDQNQPSRLTLNLAGVRVESHNAIGLAPPPPPVVAPPSLQLNLTDDATPPAALSGATFTLQGPAGPALTCLTAADGIGTCTFPELPPGSYTISETTPPPGFASADDYQLTLEPGQDYTTTFVNLPAIGSVQIALSAPGESGGPLADGVFAMFAGASTLGAPLATCTTGADGTCGFEKVPLGDYTMQQVSAPEGYLVSEDVLFSLTQPGQVATLKFVDGTPAVAAVPPVVIPGKPAVPPTVIPGKPAVPPKVIPGKPAVPPRTMVLPALDGVTDLPALEPVAYETAGGPLPVVQSQPSDVMGPLVLGGGLDALAGVPAQLARLVVRTPQQAVLLLFVWLVLGLPVYLWTRRRQFITAIEGV